MRGKARNGEEYITIEEAREIAPHLMLSALIENGIISSITFRGETLVNKAEVIEMARKMAESDGDRPITQYAAAKKYKINQRLITQWRRYGWVKEIGRSSRNAILVSERDVARLAKLCHARGKRQGKRLLPREAYPQV